MTQYYKLLREGRAPFQDFLWPIPRGKTPGEWVEVQGELGRCRNGLHLTNDPIGTRKGLVNVQCYLAEIDGETIGPYGDELVARRVRLVRRVPWSELKWVDPDPVDPIPEKPHKESPALVLLRHVWGNEGDGMSHSWDRLNHSMQIALRLAITSGLRFDPDDFATFAKDFNSGRWIGSDLGECYYALAVGRSEPWGRSHGPNVSAYQSYEKWRGRKPFLIRENPEDKSTVRLSEGHPFKWFHDGKLITIKVTSFNDAKGQFVACEYERTNGKILKRFTIDHDAIKTYHARIKEEIAKRDAAKAEAVPA